MTGTPCLRADFTAALRASRSAFRIFAVRESMRGFVCLAVKVFIISSGPARDLVRSRPIREHHLPGAYSAFENYSSFVRIGVGHPAPARRDRQSGPEPRCAREKAGHPPNTGR